MPADTPVTIPVALTVAIVLSLPDQLPPDAASLRLMVEAAHTVAGPLMLPALGAGLIVTV